MYPSGSSTPVTRAAMERSKAPEVGRGSRSVGGRNFDPVLRGNNDKVGG